MVLCGAATCDVCIAGLYACLYVSNVCLHRVYACMRVYVCGVMYVMYVCNALYVCMYACMYANVHVSYCVVL